ncbi:MAG: T9SS type A sorting domain-containing protein [Bacteroidota bacterium]
MKKLTLLFLLGLMSTQVWAQLPWPATSPGPDSYGYTWRTSDDPNGPTYDWVEIVTNNLGTPVSGLGDDNVIGKISLGLDFQYYWTTKNEICIGSNGFLSLNDGNCVNISSTADGFPPTPTNSDPNDVIAPYMCDLSFSGFGNPGTVHYFSDVANDRFVVTYSNVPYWVDNTVDPNQWSGSNTFQVILNASDSTITFQYQTMVGNWSAGYDGDPYPFVTGIENLSGNVGMLAPSLPIDASSKPTNNTAITFYPPVTPLLSITDLDVKAVDNADRAGHFVPWPQNDGSNNFPLRGLISNAGNTDVTRDIFTQAAVADTSTPQQTFTAQFDTIFGGLNQGEAGEVSYPFPFSPPFPGPYEFSIQITDNTGDLNGANDIRTAELVVVDTTGPEANFDYVSSNFPRLLSQTEPNLSLINWSSNNDDSGGGILIEPFSYPFTIVALEYLLSTLNNCTATEGMIAEIYELDPATNLPGAQLYNAKIPLNEINVDPATPAWTRHDLTTPVVIDSGAILVSYIQDDDCVVLLSETNNLGPFSLRTYEIISGTWGTYRNGTSEDMYIRAVATLDSAVFTSIDNPADLVTTFDVYPNPTAGELNILVETEQPTNMDIKIYGIDGTKVLREATNRVSRLERKLDLSTLSAGVYFVHLTTTEGVQVAKIVLQ